MTKKTILVSAVAMLTVGAFVISGYAQGERPAPAREAWEYTSVIIVREAKSGAEFTQWIAVGPDGAVKELPAPVSVPKKAAELGAAGWELVAVTPMSNNAGGYTASGSSDYAGFTSQIMYWFKRAK